jgi:diacylglycerol kinase (ATP)
MHLKISNPNQKLIIVIINKLSGGQSGNEYLNSFYRYLNPLQVINLLDETLSKLKLFSSFGNCSLIVAGGDGTVGSVINYIKEEIPEWGERMPAIAVLPLGTGNDLSRCLGWGG